jgi:hypothetical protein
MPPQDIIDMPSSIPKAVVEAEVNPLADAILNSSWWDTGDAIRYFGSANGEASPKESVVDRITQLQKGYTAATGWKLVVGDFDQQDLCSSHEFF